AHKRGIEVHAWFNAFHASSLHAGAPAAEHPDWVCRDQSGIPMNESRALSPGMTVVREYTLDVAMEIVNNYDIDGIHLDYIRWNEYSNSLRSGLSQVEQESQLDGMINDDQIRALETDRTGRYLYDVDHPYSAGIPAGYSTWADWWRTSVTTFVEMLHDSIQDVKPHVRLSVAALGKYNWSGWQGYGSVFQDAAKWFNDGSIEQLTPMHYHWLDATSFYNMLEGGCPECWSQWIQPGVAEGVLFSAGPGSYRFSDNNVWGRHPSIVEISRTVPWVDGFQFFSYGSWDYHDYWETAGSSFFSKITKVRETDHLLSTPPAQPAISLVKIDSMNYELTVTPSDTAADYWYALYRSENDSFNIDSTTIIGLHFKNNEFTVEDAFDGLQDFNGQYNYTVTQLNRFWKESIFSNSVQTDSIPSYAPTVVNANIADGDTINVSASIEINFSKTMDVGSTENALSLNPDTSYNFIWSDDLHDLTINFTNSLPYATDYTLVIDSTATDINGVMLDGDSDGLPGDSYTLQFVTDLLDILGPEIINTNIGFTTPVTGFDMDEVISIAFNELINTNTVDTSSVRLTLLGNLREYILVNNQVKNKSVISIRTVVNYPDAPYVLTLTEGLTDTIGNPITPQSAEYRNEALLYDEVVMIDNLSSVNNWADPGYSGSTTGILAGTSWNTSSSFYVPNTIPRRGARLNYVWDTSASSHMIREYLQGGDPRAVEFDTTWVLQCYLFGDGNNNKFRFALDEKVGLTWPNHEVSQWITIDWYGWRLVEWDLSDPGTVGSWIGNEILDGSKYRIDSFQFIWDSSIGDASGTIYIDELRLIKKTDDLFVDDDELIFPVEYVLHQNYPNPFNPTTTLAFTA
ncbi:MAG: family 10 glycosylhydrolase, partial [Candidatus Marinimicrobia bacterium]|nr:family 10 glycosylhydrolase [Candidatus Neomarinimicrobiota bacterium]